MADDAETASQPQAKNFFRRSSRMTSQTIKEGASGFIWLVQEPAGSENEPGLWQPLRRTDQMPLERAEAAGEPKVVAVEGGRAEVRLEERLWLDRYASIPPRVECKVRRSLWCRWVNNGWEPYEENVSTTLETGYHRLVERAYTTPLELDVIVEIDEIVKLIEPYEGRQAKLQLRSVTERAGVLSQSSPSCHWSLVATESDIDSGSWFSFSSNSVAMQRGFGDVPFKSEGDIPFQVGEVEESALSQDVDRVYVIVHGIGEKIWSKDGYGQIAQVPIFRQNLHQSRLNRLGNSQVDTFNSSEMSKEEIISVAWWEAIHSEEDDYRLQRITLPSIPDMRKFANFAVSDVLYFSQESHREKIISAVAESIETALARFRKYHSNFNGDVVLIGHSLGGVILFETLRNQRLSTKAAALFMLGSPLGMFLHCGESVPPPDYALPDGTRLFNVFHPLDPIAYRMEPLLQPHLVDVPAAQVPTKGYFGDMKMHNGIRHLWNLAAGGPKTWEEQGGKWLNLNNGERVDWALQEDLSIIGGTVSSTVEMMNALSSHSCYVKSPDVAAFIHNQCVALLKKSDSVESPDA